jgi:hypothetical protein
MTDIIAKLAAARVTTETAQAALAEIERLREERDEARAELAKLQRRLQCPEWREVIAAAVEEPA